MCTEKQFSKKYNAIMYFTVQCVCEVTICSQKTGLYIVTSFILRNNRLLLIYVIFAYSRLFLSMIIIIPISTFRYMKIYKKDYNLHFSFYVNYKNLRIKQNYDTDLNIISLVLLYCLLIHFTYIFSLIIWQACNVSTKKRNKYFIYVKSNIVLCVYFMCAY